MIIDDFGPVIAKIQIRVATLLYLGFSDWESIDLLKTWQDSKARYKLQIADYERLAANLRHKLIQIYREKQEKGYK